MASLPSYPAVVVNEIDISTSISNGQTTSYGAIAINSAWGPAQEINLIISESVLTETFDIPNNSTYIDFFVASNFLSYSSSLYVVRTIDGSARNAVAGNTAVQIPNSDSYRSLGVNLTGSGAWIAKYPGNKGNSIAVAVADGSVALTEFVNGANNSLGTWGQYFNMAPTTSDYSIALGGRNDELHVLVFDEDGLFSGIAGTLLESYSYLSKVKGAQKENGTSNFYQDVINSSSKYIWAGDTYVLGANNSATGSSIFTNVGASKVSLSSGVDVNTSNTAMYINAYELFSDKKSIDVSHFITGNIPTTAIQPIITLAEKRGDSIAYFSPRWADVQQGQSQSTIAQNIASFKNTVINYSSSYYFVDGNWKYQYDKYNDINRWIPCNGDSAGLKAAAEASNDIWWNGSGYNRGILKNVIKLAWNPQDDYMGIIYKNSVNPIISDGGVTVLLGDKTGLIKPSSFDRINVRSLFNLLKKVISSYLKYGLFEFSDQFTWVSLSSHVNTYLQSVQSRRGIQDFYVQCDSSNNNGQTQQNNEIVMSVYIKPNYSANWIILNMVNVGGSASFSEVVGSF